MEICAGDDTKDNEIEVPRLKDPTTAAMEICAGDDTILAREDKNDNVNDEKEHPDDMVDDDHVNSPDSIDRGIAEEKYEENETKYDGFEIKNAVYTPQVQEEDNNERTDNELETGNPVFASPVNVEGYEGEGLKKKQE